MIIWKVLIISYLIRNICFLLIIFWYFSFPNIKKMKWNLSNEIYFFMKFIKYFNLKKIIKILYVLVSYAYM